MKLTFKRREVKDLQHLSTLVAENVEAIEPGLKILASNLNLGRTSIEIAAVDGANTPVLITLGITADDTMLVRALEAYAWCLEYPESLERLVPATMRLELPPRMVFVAERLLEAFVRKMRLLRFNAVECFEYRYVESGGTTGFYLDRVDWDQSGSGVPEPPIEKPERRSPPAAAPPAPPRPEPVPVPPPPPAAPAVVAEEPPPPVPEERVVMVYEEPPAAPRPEPPIARREPPKVVTPEPKPPREEPKLTPREEPHGTPGERPPVVLKGLKPPIRKPRDVPHIPRPLFEEATPSQRPGSAAPTPATPAVARAARPEAKLEPTVDPRLVQRGLEAYTKSAPSKNGGPRSDPARGDGPKSDAAAKNDAAKGDLAPTWRKFLDRLTSTFEPRAPAPPSETAQPLASRDADAPSGIQPFAADIDPGVQEAVHDAVTELSDKQINILPGLTLPDNGELAPQWRKFLDHPTLDEAKIAVVRAYLQREFPLCTVYDFYDFQRNAQVFQLQDNHGKVTQLITMTAEFFDTHRDLEIRAWIEKHRLAHAMRQAGQAGVLVSQAGLQIEKR
jgi:hypothetical protein